MPVGTQTLYEVLMVDPGIDADVLAAVYRRHVQRMLATPNGGGAADMLRLRALEQAYEVLRDPERRQRYDVELGLRARRAAWRSEPTSPAAPATAPPPSAPPAPRSSATSTARGPRPRIVRRAYGERAALLSSSTHGPRVAAKASVARLIRGLLI